MPMLGGSVLAAHDRDTEQVGLELEAAWWLGRIGIAAEGSRRWAAIGDAAHVNVLGASLRLLAFSMMTPSVIGSRDVEVAIELHGIVERRWDTEQDAYGGGFAIRLRGGGDDHFPSPLLAESRFFVRVLASRADTIDTIARGETAMPTTERDVTVVIGIGVAWGMGTRRYLDRFRIRPIETLWFGGERIDR